MNYLISSITPTSTSTCQGADRIRRPFSNKHTPYPSAFIDLQTATASSRVAATLSAQCLRQSLMWLHRPLVPWVMISYLAVVIFHRLPFEWFSSLTASVMQVVSAPILNSSTPILQYIQNFQKFFSLVFLWDFCLGCNTSRKTRRNCIDALGGWSIESWRGRGAWHQPPKQRVPGSAAW